MGRVLLILHLYTANNHSKSWLHGICMTLATAWETDAKHMMWHVTCSVQMPDQADGKAAYPEGTPDHFGGS